MRDEISRLVNLQALDQELIEREQALAKISSRIDELRQLLERSQSELDQLETEGQQTLLARRELERRLSEGEAQIRNKRMRLTAIRNDKEFQAIEHEVATLKETNQRLEVEVIASMETAEQREPRIKELKGLIAQNNAELKAAQKEVAAEIEELKATVVAKRLEREQLAAGIEPELRRRYEMIFERRAGLAVAEAKAGTCQGCRMRIPPQLHNEIQKSLRIHFCPNCQRILYLEP